MKKRKAVRNKKHIKKKKCCEEVVPYTEKIHGKCFKTTNEWNCLK